MCWYSANRSGYEEDQRCYGVNSNMVTRITGRNIAQEARPATCSFKKIRQRLPKWLVNLLRSEEDRLTYQVLQTQLRL